MRLLAIVVLAAASCRPAAERERDVPSSRVEPSNPVPSESQPIRQGYTQRPPRNAPGLPTPPEPFLTPAEEEALREKSAAVSAEARIGAERELVALLDAFAQEGVDQDRIRRLNDVAREHVRQARVLHLSADALYEAYAYPNEAAGADATFKGRPVILTGTVAPHNMTDVADGFKLFEQTAYAHEPVLLATEQELVFVRCRLVHPELQKLRDWQEIHVAGIVSGKDRGDVVLERCVVVE